MTSNLAIVVLNYLNYWDTIECVDSIIEQQYDICGIVIVDNASDNDSLKKLIRRYRYNSKIHIIKARKNYGFAKGNNIGIQYARSRLNAEYVFVTNNDTIFVESDYFKKLLAYDAEKVGVIGSQIRLKDGKRQGWVSANVSFHNLILQYIIESLYMIGCNKILIDILEDQKKKNNQNILHGCALLFTPTFFRYYDGFYSHTFLYHEEEILYLLCQRHGLKQVYVRDAVIYHKEDCSSAISFNNDNKKMKSFSRKSIKHIILVKFYNAIRGERDD